MNNDKITTLSSKMNQLNDSGFKESFDASGDSIEGKFSKRNYKPQDLSIVQSFRFEGATNPGDQTVLFAIEANDGTKGTLVMSYSADHSQNVELIKQIPSEE